VHSAGANGVKMPISKIDDPIYGQTIHFIFDMPFEKAVKYLKPFADYYDFSKLEQHWEKAGCAYAGSGHHAFIIFPDNKKTWTYTTTLAHEALHVTSAILRRKGIELTWESEEAFTYYHSFIMQRFTDVYEAHYKKRKKVKK
jgi:hypothetical protein